MSEPGARLALPAFRLATFLLAAPALLAAAPVLAEPAVTILDLPFKARAMRGPGSDVSLAVATSGLLPLARPKGLKGEVVEEAPGAVIWGDEGGAVLTLAEGRVVTTLVGAEAVEGFSAAETPRGAVPGTRRAVLGPVTAYLSDPLRATATAPERAGTLTLRERQPVGMSGDPKPVPVVTTALTAGAEAAFALRRPLAALLDERPVFVTVTAQAGGSPKEAGGSPQQAGGSSQPAGGSSLAVIGKDAAGAWTILARGPVQAPGPGGQAQKPAALGAFSQAGRPQIASVAAPDGAGLLQLWAYEGSALRLLAEVPGYTDLSPGEDGADLAAALDADADGVQELALPVADRGALAILSLKDGIREIRRLPLPGPAAFGVAAIGRGAQTRLLVGLADGRVALVSP